MKNATVQCKRPAWPPILDPIGVERLLAREAGLVWPSNVAPKDVRVERAWPTRGGGLSVEWSFRINGRHRCLLFGRVGNEGWTDLGAPADLVRVTRDGIRGVCVRAERWAVRVHSPDLDPELPHLARCLEGEALSADFHGGPSLLSSNGTKSRPAPRGRLLSYRAGRRATIGYQLEREREEAVRSLVGKTFHDDRGLRLGKRCTELDAALEAASCGRVRAARPLGYLPEFRMLVFPGHPSTQKVGRRVSRVGGRGSHPGTAVGTAGIEAIASLHRVSLPDLPRFDAAAEFAVVQRWHEALRTWNPAAFERSRRIVAALCEASLDVDDDRWTTIHRDFYDSQFVRGPGRTTILDLDTLAAGDPALDIGNYLAHSCLAAAAGRRLGAFTDAAVRLLHHYRELGGAPSRRAVRFYWASSLFRVGAVHSFRHGTRRWVRLLWSLAADILDTATGPWVGAAPTSAALCDTSTILGAIQT